MAVTRPNTIPDVQREPLVDDKGFWRRAWFDWFQKQFQGNQGFVTGSGTAGGLTKWSTTSDLTTGQLTGDVTTPSNSTVATLANTAVTPGTYGDSTHVSQVTFDAKGRATSATNVAIAATGTVTHTGTLTAGQAVLGNGGADIIVDPNVAVIRQSVFILTDSQIKALPTTPVTLIAAPGANHFIKVLAVTYVASTSAGNYTGLNATYVDLHMLLGSYYVSYGPVNDNTTTPALTLVSQLLAGSGTNLYEVGQPSQSAVNAVPPTGNGYVLNTTVTGTGLNNQPLQITADNNGSGNFTGGNAANTLRITVYWQAEATA